MDKVYGIGTGEYSDWNIVGFFTDKLQAEKYCQFMNDKYPHENYEVCELENLNENIDLSLIYPKYTFTFNGKFNDYWENVQGSLAVNGEKTKLEKIKMDMQTINI